MRKVIFLDIDGVMNSRNDYYSYTMETDSHLKLLKQIIDATDAEIVLSSTWRLFKDSRDVVHRRLQEFGMDFIGCTPDSSSDLMHRGDQIRRWLKDNPNVTSFVILDNDNDMCELITHLVRTDTSVGLQKSDVDKAINMLKE